MLILPVFSFEVLKNLFDIQKKQFRPQNSYLLGHPARPNDVSKQEDFSYQAAAYTSSSVLHEIKLNTSEWQCIKTILMDQYPNHQLNSTGLLVTAVSKHVVYQIMDCYTKQDGYFWEGWWETFKELEPWKLIKENYLLIIFAAVGTIVLLTLFCRLCRIICKKRRDDEVFIT